jgi:glutamyl/glutaminyl-tRNA synthetase
MLEAVAREELDDVAPRAMCVLRPLRVVIETLSERAEADDAEGVAEWLSLAKFPKDEARGTRHVPLTREVFIERADFREEEPPPPAAAEFALLSKKAQKRMRAAAFNRLTLHQPVRLRGAYVISVTGVFHVPLHFTRVMLTI